jgi:hypothetical protein
MPFASQARIVAAPERPRDVAPNNALPIRSVRIYPSLVFDSEDSRGGLFAMLLQLRAGMTTATPGLDGTSEKW